MSDNSDSFFDERIKADLERDEIRPQITSKN